MLRFDCSNGLHELVRAKRLWQNKAVQELLSGSGKLNSLVQTFDHMQYLLNHLMDNYFDGVKNDIIALLK